MFFRYFCRFTTNTQNIVGLSLHPSVLLDDGKTNKGNVLIRSPGIDFHMEIISIVLQKGLCSQRLSCQLI